MVGDAELGATRIAAVTAACTFRQSSWPTPAAPSASKELSMNDHDIILGRFARSFIRHKARLLSKYPEFQDQLIEDLEQELFLRLTSGMDLFDPVLRHPNVFVTTVVERAIAQMLRKRRAAKSGSGRVFPSSALTENELDQFDPSDRRRQSADLNFDLAAAIAKLPRNWQRLVKLLRHDYSTKEIADELKVSKDTVNRWVTKIRRQFEDDGLQIYL
jgi:RNA polymerase sigma factor (sigma-70 family)